MAVYLIGFALSLALIALGEKKRFPVFLGLSAIALLIPCLLAGLRAETVGTDVLVYVKPLTKAAILSEDLRQYFQSYWFDVWHNVYTKDYEIGFSLLVFGIAKLTKNLNIVLFVIQALTVVPVFVALARNRKTMPVWLGMLVYYLLFFNSTLNMMRQWIAMAFLLLSMQMLLEKRPGLTILFAVIGFLFHYTALLVVPVYLVYWFVWLPRRTRLVHNNFSLRGTTAAVLLFFLVGILAVMNVGLFAKLLAALGMRRFLVYISGSVSSLMLNQIILRLPLLLYLVIHWKPMLRTSKAAPFYMAMVLLDIVASQLVGLVETAYRISFYFSIYTIVWVPAVYRCSETKLKRNLSTGLLAAYLLLHWYYFHVVSLRHQTYPYVFANFF